MVNSLVDLIRARLRPEDLAIHIAVVAVTRRPSNQGFEDVAAFDIHAARRVDGSNRHETEIIDGFQRPSEMAIEDDAN